MRSASVLRLLPLAALPERLCPALWGELCERLGLTQATGQLAALLDRGMLKQCGEELVLCLSRKKQSELVSSLAVRDALLFRRAHEICAGFYSRRGAAFDLAAAVKHFLAIGDRRSAEALLSRWGYAAIETRWVPSFLDALASLTSGDAPIAGFLLYLKARALEQTGELSGAADAYEQALASSALGSQLEARAPRWFPRPSLLAARAGLLALRIGQLQRATRMLERARRLSTKRVPAAVHHLSARIGLSLGDLNAAVQQFRLAIRAASSVKDADEEAEAWSGLGVVAMRSGDPRRAAEHYRQALACGSRGELRIARIQANLAMALVLIGHYTEATRLFEDAARVRESLGDMSGAANSFAACASAREGAFDLAGAFRDLSRARHLAALARDPALELEIHLLRGMLSLRRGEHAAGRACIRAARSIRGALEAADPLLEAMLLEASAELSLSAKQYVAAAQLARNALRIARRHGATYHASRIHLLFARIAYAAGRRASALRHLFSVARSVVPMGLCFPHVWALHALLQLGSGCNDAMVRRFCEQSRQTGVPFVQRVSVPYEGSYRIVDRSGARLAEEAEVSRLRMHPPDLLLDLPLQRLRSLRGVFELGGRRVLIPLLLAFVENRGRALEAEELHRLVWGVDRFDDAARTRLKVALSRLRALVGPSLIETLRSTDPSGVVRTSFSLSARARYVLIDRP